LVWQRISIHGLLSRNLCLNHGDERHHEVAFFIHGHALRAHQLTGNLIPAGAFAQKATVRTYVIRENFDRYPDTDDLVFSARPAASRACRVHR